MARVGKELPGQLKTGTSRNTLHKRLKAGYKIVYSKAENLIYGLDQSKILCTYNPIESFSQSAIVSRVIICIFYAGVVETIGSRGALESARAQRKGLHKLGSCFLVEKRKVLVEPVKQTLLSFGYCGGADYETPDDRHALPCPHSLPFLWLFLTDSVHL